MFGRRRDERRSIPETPSASIGVGALVRLLSEPGGEFDWVGEPVGVVIAAGDSDIGPYPGLVLGSRAQWLVAVEGGARTKDGRGPVERISVPSRLLVPLPVEEQGGAAPEGS